MNEYLQKQQVSSNDSENEESSKKTLEHESNDMHIRILKLKKYLDNNKVDNKQCI